MTGTTSLSYGGHYHTTTHPPNMIKEDKQPLEI